MKSLISVLFLIFIVACTGSTKDTDSFIRDGFILDTGNDGISDTALDLMDNISTHDEGLTDAVQDVKDAAGDITGDVTVQEGVQPLLPGYTGQINAFCRDQDGNTYAVGTNGYCALVRSGDFLPLGFPVKRDLTSCACDGDTLYVAGMEGTVFKYDQDGWTNLAPPVSTDILGIGAARGLVYAVGNKGLILQWTGKDWNTQFTGVDYDLHAIWFNKAAGPFVAGTGGMMLYQQGDVWMVRQIAFPTSTIYGIYRDPSGLLVAVGTRGLIVTSQNNNTWQVQVTNESADPVRDLYAVYGLGPKAIYAVGAKAAVFKFDGSKWTAAKLKGPYNTGQDLFALAVWTDQDSTDRVLAMGSAGKGLFFDGKDFVDAFAGIQSGLRGLNCGTKSITAVGQNGVVLKIRDGTISALVPNTTNDINTASTHYAVGAKGTILDMGTLTLRDDCGITSDLYGVIDVANGSMAVGQGGVVVDIGGQACVTGTPLPGIDLNGLAELTDQSVVIVGNDGTVLLRKNDKFTKVSTGIVSNLRSVAAYGQGAIIVGDNGIVLLLKGNKITRIAQKPASFLYGVAVFGELAFITGWAGNTWIYDGTDMTQVSSNTPVTLNAVCQQNGRFFIAGDEGFLGEYQ